jgi:acid phosphatase type 7
MIDQPPSGSPAGRAALGLLGFVAALILLFGLATLVGQSGGRGAAVASSTPTGAAGTPSPRQGTPTPTGSATASASASGASPSPSAAADPTLVGAGDIAACGLDTDTATAKLIDAMPGAVFTAGDNAYPDGTPDQFKNCYAPTWGQFLDRTRPAAGNHDWQTRDLAGYLGYFGAEAAPDGKSWYAYDLGTWHIVVLDSDCGSVGGCGADSVQGHWLSANLAASSARCTLAIWHHPRFSSGEHGNDEEVAPFWRTLYDAGADVVINGHDHDYERFAPQDPDAHADGARGIREFVVGTGGAALRTFPSTVANSELRAIAHGVIRLVLHPSSYDWSFTSTTGDVLDSGSSACH